MRAHFIIAVSGQEGRDGASGVGLDFLTADDADKDCDDCGDETDIRRLVRGANILGDIEVEIEASGVRRAGSSGIKLYLFHPLELMNIVGSVTLAGAEGPNAEKNGRASNAEQLGAIDWPPRSCTICRSI